MADGGQIIAIGDIHGCFEGLVEILLHANIIKRNSSPVCSWGEEVKNTVIIQLGDVVDRYYGGMQYHIIVIVVEIVIVEFIIFFFCI
jgi:hypothetical protein